MSLSAFLSQYSKSSSTSRDITYHNLHNSDIKKLVSILRSYPIDPSDIPAYYTITKKNISKLPSHLRSSTLANTLLKPPPEDKATGKVKSGKLCSMHNDLNHGLIHSIFSSLRFEFEKGIGHFLYPLLVGAGLTASQETKLRVLEPVLQLWDPDFDITDHTPPEREHLRPVVQVNGHLESKWSYQGNECAACLLSRINSDKDVLFAMMAIFVGRYPERKLGRKGDIKSRRVRWARYGLKAFEDGDRLAEEAWDLGEELRRVRKAWREHQERRGKKSFYGRRVTGRRAGDGAGSGEDSASSRVGARSSEGLTNSDFQEAGRGWHARAESFVSDIGVDISEPWSLFDNDIVRGLSAYVEPPPRNPNRLAYEQNTSHSLPQQTVNTRRQTNESKYTSISSSSESNWEAKSEFSYDTTSSEEIAHDYRSHVSLLPPPLNSVQVRNPFLAVPKPNRNSMYAAFACDDESVYEVSPPHTPIIGLPSHSPGEMLGSDVYGDRRSLDRQKRHTKWSDLY